MNVKIVKFKNSPIDYNFENTNIECYQNGACINENMNDYRECSDNEINEILGKNVVETSSISDKNTNFKYKNTNSDNKNKYFGILTAYSTFALNVPTKRQEPTYVSLECQLSIKRFQNDNIKTEEELKKHCDIINNNECQEIFTTNFTECKNDIYYFDKVLKIEWKLINEECATDEQGNFCPLTSIEKSKRINNTMTEQQHMDYINFAVKDTCKSQKCIDIYVSSTEDSEKLLSQIEETKVIIYSDKDMKKINRTFNKEALNYLKSAKCAPEAKSNSIIETISSSVTEVGVIASICIIVIISLIIVMKKKNILTKDEFGRWKR